MIDLNYLRAHPELFATAVRAKRIDLDLDELLALDRRRAELLSVVEALRADRNRMSAQTKDLENEGRVQHLTRCRQIAADLGKEEEALRRVTEQLAALMLLVPSLPGDDVPDGESDLDNVELYRWGQSPEFDFVVRDHLELCAQHRLAIFDAARGVSGSRAYALCGQGVLLEMALLRFALDKLIEEGFTPVAPPLMVKESAMIGTGYFPLGADNAYALLRDDGFLVGTAEVPLMALQTDQCYDFELLPLRFAGISTCFRREAGAAGRDTKGLFRVHQFQKVEQVVITGADPVVTEREHMKLLRNAEELLQALELPYRVVAVCTGDLGLGPVRKHDIETWMPSRNAYCETHSCSTLNDFQARRLKIRYRDCHGRKHYVHTLNNTALASPRILIPLLENHQRRDGTIYVPRALRPYLGGREVLEPFAEGKAVER